MSLLRQNGSGHLAALCAIIIWGGAFVAAQIALEAMSPTVLMFLRIAIAVLATTLIHPRPLGWLGWRTEGYYVLGGLLGIFFYYYLQNAALIYTSASNVSVLCALAPIVTALAAPLLLRTPRPHGLFYAGCLLAAAGSALPVYNGSAVLQLNPRGDVLALLNAVVWGLYAIVSKKISSFGHPLIPSVRKMFVYALLFSAVLLLFQGVQVQPEDLVRWDVLGSVAYLGLLASTVSYLLWNYAIQQLGSVRATTYIYLEPLVTMAVAAAMLGDSITWIALLGAALIIGGLFLTKLKQAGA